MFAFDPISVFKFINTSNCEKLRISLHVVTADVANLLTSH